MFRLTIACLCMSAAVTRAGIPATLTHQGVVAVKGERFTGQGEFRFALVRSESDDYLWTNDGSAVVHPDPPTAAVSLTVINGVYNAILGDPLANNMTAIPESVFAPNEPISLRLWFDDGRGNGVHRLTPDVPITHTPYALRASLCDALSIPETAEAAVFADGNGNVLIPGGDLTLEGGDAMINGDLNVLGGEAIIAGDLTVGGSFTNFEVAGPFTAQTSTFGSDNTDLTSVANSFCALTEVQIGYSPSISNADIGTCRIQSSGGLWVLTARIDGSLFDIGRVFCEARCFVFGGP